MTDEKTFTAEEVHGIVAQTFGVAAGITAGEYEGEWTLVLPSLKMMEAIKEILDEHGVPDVEGYRYDNLAERFGPRLQLVQSPPQQPA